MRADLWRIPLAGALAAACLGGPAPSTTPDVPGDPDSAILRFERLNGLVPAWQPLVWYPLVSVYADGRIIEHVPAAYPGPALPELTVVRVDGDGLAQILELAAELGLEGPDRELGQSIPDGGVMIFTVVRGDERHQTRVLGPDPDPGRTPLLHALVEFGDALADPASWLGDDITADEKPYAWRRMRLVVVPVNPADLPDPRLVTMRDWAGDPLATLGDGVDEAHGARCALVEGAELARLRSEFDTADELTVWLSDEQTYQLHPRPLLPDETACPSI
ncbi:MAG TPA: hypothetical protein VMP67_09390 [Candidatus Limnocylindria bacterium]|nr:hypothetical protein [Candidatus Limnocylindria bacterium]